MATPFDTVLTAVYDGLHDHAALSYIKKWFKGELDLAKPIFPFIAVGDISFDVEAETTGRQGNDLYLSDITVVAGQKSLAGIAYSNTDDDNPYKKGIIQIADDILSVARVNDFSQTFRGPVNISDARVEPGGGDQSGFIWLAWFTITGDLIVRRNA